MSRSIDGVREHWQQGHQVCTFQIHMRRRDRTGRLKPVRSKSITFENISLDDGIRIVRLGIEAFKAARN